MSILELHPTSEPQVFRSVGRDGTDYRRICDRHGWASATVEAFQAAITYRCVFCEAEASAASGVERFRKLQLTSVRIAAKPVSIVLCPVFTCQFEASGPCEDDALSTIGQHIINCHPAQAETATRL